MNENQTTPQLQDITISEEFQNGCYVMRQKKLKELTSYLFSDSVFPLTNKIKKLIKPKSMLAVEADRTFHEFTKIYKNQSDLIIQVPIFTLVYSSRILTNLSPKEIPINFIHKYLEDLKIRNINVNENILDLIIPFTIYKQFIQDNPPTIEPFFIFLSNFFNPTVFLKHFLGSLHLMVKDGIVTSFHIDLVSSLYSNFDYSKEEGDQIEQIVIKPFSKADVFSIRISCINLKKQIETKRSTEIENEIEKPVDKFEKLNMYLDFIEKGNLKISLMVLLGIRDELFIVNQFPNRSPLPLMTIAVPFYTRLNDDDNQKSILALIFKLNSVCDDAELYQCYLYLNDNIEILQIDPEFLEMCYQNFLNCSKESHPSHLVVPKEQPKVEQHIKKNKYEEIIKEAIDLLINVETSYDGTQLIWKLIEYENVIVYLEKYIRRLEYRPKVYLAYGLRALEDESPRTQETDEIIQKLNEEILQLS